MSGKARAGVGVWERMFSKLEDIARISTLRRMLPGRSPTKRQRTEELVNGLLTGATLLICLETGYGNPATTELAGEPTRPLS